MRLSLLTLCWFLATCIPAISASAEEQVEAVPARPAVVKVPITPELIDAYRNLQVARLQMQKYRFVELPLLRRQLDDQIRLVETQTRNFRGRIRDYLPIEEVGDFSPVRQDVEDYRLRVQASEALLRRLKDQRIALMRTTRHSLELYQFDILRAAAQVSRAKRAALQQVQGR